MVSRRYQGSGEAFVGATALGRADLHLLGFASSRMRKADGEIEFAERFPSEFLGQQVKFVPYDGTAPFHLVVTSILNGRTTVTSDGDMPWWQ